MFMLTKRSEMAWLKTLYGDRETTEAHKKIAKDFYWALFKRRVLKNYDIQSFRQLKNHSAIFELIGKKDQEKYVLKIVHKSKFTDDDLKQLLKIDHPNIQKVYHIFETKHYYYFIKSYAVGELLSVMVSNRLLDANEPVISIAQQLLAAVQYLHDMTPPIIYRDIEPDNIIVSSDYRVTLIDSDTFKRKNIDTESQTYYIASKTFAAPELFGLLPPDQRTDIYSLGATLFYVATQKLPTREAVDHYELFPEEWPTSQKLYKAIKKCLEFDPKNRIQDIHDFNI